jgi:hypothetical protein
MIGLQVEDLHHAGTSKDMVASFDALLESQALQQMNHGGKWDVRVCVTSQDLVEQLVCIRHIVEGRRSVTQTIALGKFRPILQGA